MFRAIKNFFLNWIEGRSFEEIRENREFFRKVHEQDKINNIPLNFVGFCESEEEAPKDLKEKECVMLPDFSIVTVLDGQRRTIPNQGIQFIGYLDSVDQLPKTARPGFGYYIKNSTGYETWVYCPNKNRQVDDPENWILVSEDASLSIASQANLKNMSDKGKTRWL